MKKYHITALVASSLFFHIAIGPTAQAQTRPPSQDTSPGNEILDPSVSARRSTRPTYTFAPDINIPSGSTQLSWESVKANFQVPAWLQDGKFGIFIHWGPYTVAAHHNEWYPKHMYNNPGIAKWHQEKFGPQDKFGYKDLIPLFKAEKFDAKEWAALFKEAGARFVVPAGEHHDRFAMWDSKLTKWDAKEMGPKRDVIGELAKSVRAQGLKYGISNHRMFGYDFMVPADKTLKTDLYDPAYADFYGPLPTEQKTMPNQEFVNGWLARTIELIDLYQPDFLWFDWDGTGAENPVKLQFANYYFTRAKQWGKQVAFSQKGDTFPFGTGITSHEKGGRMPKEITSNVWMVDDVISNRSWSYVEGMTYRSATSIVHELSDAVSRNGTMMLNISPRADGVIPQEQQDILRSIGRWLNQNGEAIYSTRPWVKASEGDVSFTVKGDALYAICKKWPGEALSIPSLGKGQVTSIDKISLLGSRDPIGFTQHSDKLVIKVPKEKPGEHAWVFKITGLQLKK
ncbi:MAG: alpha-L-fucosidase [Sphingobacteriaceae bacterium]|nr:alpha-L-fucosidase [Sphingobacteriaceae bacterium]